MEFKKESHFELHVNLWVSESSLDSHNDFYELHIIDKHVTLKMEHSGFPDPSSSQEELILTDTMYSKLIDFIKEKQLNTSIKEVKPTANMGISIRLNLNLKFENKTNSISISGMYNDWKLRGTGMSCNIENHIYYSHINRIIAMIRNKSEFL